MYYKKKPKWQQKEYIPQWIDELLYKPFKIEAEKERIEKQKKLIIEAKAIGLISENYEPEPSEWIKEK